MLAVFENWPTTLCLGHFCPNYYLPLIQNSNLLIAITITSCVSNAIKHSSQCIISNGCNCFPENSCRRTLALKLDWLQWKTNFTKFLCCLKIFLNSGASNNFSKTFVCLPKKTIVRICFQMTQPSAKERELLRFVKHRTLVMRHLTYRLFTLGHRPGVKHARQAGHAPAKVVFLKTIT